MAEHRDSRAAPHAAGPASTTDLGLVTANDPRQVTEDPDDRTSLPGRVLADPAGVTTHVPEDIRLDQRRLDLLRLLAEGAPSSQMAHVDADPIDPEATALAVRAARRLEDARVRERALRALVDTARDLAATTDPDGVLDAIVRRARVLLGTDVSYLTLYDEERGDTYMRATDGTVAGSFRTLRLDLGVGLGGLVASTQEAWWTSDYPNDDRFEHTTTIDAGVGDEGLRAICGTPLLVEEQFVGVLFAAYRRVHTFTQDAVALLGSLASLAAVAIVQTRARSATHAAMHALSLANEAGRRHTEEVERSAQAHDRFTQLVVSGGGVDDITSSLGELLSGWTVLIDLDGLRRSSYGAVPGEEPEAGGRDPLADLPIVAAARASRRAVVADGMYAVAVQARRETFAVLICGTTHARESSLRIVERAGAVTTVLLLFERDRALARQQVLSDKVSEVLAGTLPPYEAARLAAREGLNPARPFCLVALRGGPVERSLVLATSAAVGPNGLVGLHERYVVALVAGEDPGAAAAALVRRVGSGSDPVTAAGVGPLTGTDGLRGAFAEARRTVDALIALGRQGEGLAAGDLGFAGLIVGSTPDVASYVQRVLGPVLDYDRERGTDLAATVEAYFAAERSPRRTASALHVHANTVVQRLERVGALLGPLWSEPESALEIQLALRLRRLLPR